MAASVLTSYVLGPAKLIFNAGGVGPAKFNIRTDPFANWSGLFVKLYIESERLYTYTWRMNRPEY